MPRVLRSRRTRSQAVSRTEILAPILVSTRGTTSTMGDFMSSIRVRPCACVVCRSLMQVFQQAWSTEDQKWRSLLGLGSV